MHVRAAQGFKVHVFTGHGLNHLRTCEEHVRLFLHHDNEVGKRGGVRRAASAWSHNQADLRHNPGVLGIAPEDFRIAAQAFHAFLDARAARVNHSNDRRAVLGGQVHHAANLAAVHLAQSPALHGEILGINVHRAPIHLAIAGYHSVSQGRFRLRVILLHHQCFKLPKAAFVQQQQDAFPRGEAALGMLFVNAGLPAG